jgi:acetoin:2,6-dichlorophenolindophenol oxidoreductase subunit alpha
MLTAREATQSSSKEGLGGKDAEQVTHLLREMIRIRKFEQRVQRAFLDGLVHGTTHLCIGQEAISVGVVAALRADDYITYTYRGHGICIARGMPFEPAFAEIFGRSTGICGGLGGSMHLTDPELNLIGCAGIVGSGLPMAVGAGLSAQLSGRGQLSVTFFGDGATNIGAFHESLNMAAVWKLPVLFVCENNYYGEFSRIDHTTPFEELVRRGAAYAMNSVSVDGNDVLAVRDAAAAAGERARSGAGPSFIECRTYRHLGHSRTDPAKYRPQAEFEAWLARDPLRLLETRLTESGAVKAEDIAQLYASAEAEAAEAAEAAANAPWPNVSDYPMHALAVS